MVLFVRPSPPVSRPCIMELSKYGIESNQTGISDFQLVMYCQHSTILATSATYILKHSERTLRNREIYLQSFTKLGPLMTEIITFIQTVCINSIALVVEKEKNFQCTQVGSLFFIFCKRKYACIWFIPVC